MGSIMNLMGFRNISHPRGNVTVCYRSVSPGKKMGAAAPI